MPQDIRMYMYINLRIYKFKYKINLLTQKRTKNIHK